MESQEYQEIKEMIGQLDAKVDLIGRSLKTCQSRCHVDNPPKSRWRGLGRALLAMVKF